MILAIGLMSGTSIDGIDAALCRFENGAWSGIVATHSQAYPEPLRDELLAMQLEPGKPRSLRDWVRLDEDVAIHFAGTANALMRKSGVGPGAIAVIGSHGQTVFHDPRGIGSSWQLGNPSRIAALTGVTTVADFRRADIAHGGEGAPLVPAFHQALFFDPAEPRCVLNVGGIANLTVLEAGSVKGFDTGPGNALMDSWCERHRRGAYDENGQWAAGGALHQPLLDTLAQDPYFAQPPPKSTGRDRFNLEWILARYPQLDLLEPASVQRTLCELTARTVAAAVGTHAPGTRRVMVCGGGARNRFLMERLAALMPATTVETTDAHGLDTQWVESAAFAWLALQTLEGRPGNLPSATGACRPAILGGIYRA